MDGCTTSRAVFFRPPESPRESGLTDSIRHPSYPVEELGGLVFAYLGPQPVPLLPRFDFLAGDGEH